MTAFIRNFIFGIAWLIGISSTGKAAVVVWDPGLAAQNAGNEITNLTHWVATETNTLNTELNTLHQYENMVVQLARLGNPGALQSLPGIGTIAELYSSGQQLMQTYQRISAMANPAAIQGQLSALRSAYSLQRWNPLSAGSYEFPTASYTVAQTVQQQMQQLEQQRQTLQKQRDSALNSLQSASTVSDVQKYSAQIIALNGAIAEVGARANELAQQSQLQRQQLEAGQAVFKAQTTESATTTFGRGISSEMDQLNALAPDYTQTPHWNQ